MIFYEVFKMHNYERKVLYSTTIRLLAFAKAHKNGLMVWWYSDEGSRGSIHIIEGHITHIPFGWDKEFIIPFYKSNDLAIYQQDLLRRKEFMLKPRPKRDWFWEYKNEKRR